MSVQSNLQARAAAAYCISLTNFIIFVAESLVSCSEFSSWCKDASYWEALSGGGMGSLPSVCCAPLMLSGGQTVTANGTEEAREQAQARNPV